MSAVRTATGLRTIAGIHIRDADNVLREVTQGQIRNAANALKTFFSGFQGGAGGSVRARPFTVTSTLNSGYPVLITTRPAEVTVEGGVAPYTYSWAATASTGPWTINSPTLATTTFSCTADKGDQFDATFVCTVTDAAEREVESNPVIATVRNNYGGFIL